MCTFSQDVKLNMRDLEPVGEHNIIFYVVITAKSSSGSSTMCILSHTIGGIIILLGSLLHVELHNVGVVPYIFSLATLIKF